MTGRLPISLLSALAWGQLSKALAPADPTITAPALLPRQNNDRFIGWVETEGTWYSQQCDVGLTWYQEGKYAQCCPTSLASCYAPTACVDGSLIYPYSDIGSTTTIACTENYDNTAYSICNTAFIFENFDDSNPKTDIVCGDSSLNWSYYRKVPASATEIVSSNEPSSSISSGPVSSDTETPTPAPIPQPQKGKKSESKAWIAGVVVGPIVGLAIIGAIIFFLMRRKKNKNATTQPPAVGVAVAPVAQYSDAKPQFTPHQSMYGQPSPGYNPQDPYNQYGQQPLSPAPQYSAPHSAPGSPPPEGHYAPDQKQAFQHVDPNMPQAAELGGASSPVGGTYTVELSGEPSQPK